MERNGSGASGVIARALATADRCEAAGDFAGAEQIYRNVLAAAPEHGETLFRLARLAFRFGQAAGALSLLEQAARIQPDEPSYREALATVRAAVEESGFDEAAAARTLLDLYQSGDLAALVRTAKNILVGHPDFGFAWNLLGVSLVRLGQDGVPALQRAVALAPGDGGTLSNLAEAYRSQGALTEAAATCRAALVADPDLAAAHINLSAVLHSLGQYPGAADHARRALDLCPSNPAAWGNLANAEREQGNLAEAVRLYRRGLGLAPEDAKLLIGLGVALQRAGEPEEAVSCLRRVQGDGADALEAQSALLFTLNYVDASADEIREANERHRDLVARQVLPSTTWPNLPDPDRPLRIGFVSGDLRAHPVGYFIESVLSVLARDPKREFDWVAYRTLVVDDAVWERLRPNFAVVRDVAGLADAALGELIGRDGIDILVDLAGHSAHNRLAVFARKPAPVQVSWLGYFASTAVPAMDYILADEHVVPRGEETLYTEPVWRLPHSYLCFTPPAEDIVPRPMDRDREIVFGCFNSLAKLNDAVLDCWSAILLALPSARLFLKARQLGSPEAAAVIRDRFSRRGIDPARLRLEGPSPRRDYLIAFGDIDVALDPFPFPGGTTTVEGLWMGVPVITRRGCRWIGHQGEMILRNLGHPEWIADDEGDYVRKAVALATDRNKLAELRAGLRQELLASPLCDASRLARDIGAAWRAMWRCWCAGQPSRKATAAQ